MNLNGAHIAHNCASHILQIAQRAARTYQRDDLLNSDMMCDANIFYYILAGIGLSIEVKYSVCAQCARLCTVCVW